MDHRLVITDRGSLLDRTAPLPVTFIDL